MGSPNSGAVQKIGEAEATHVLLIVAERFRTDKGYHTQFDMQALETGPIQKPLIIGERRIVGLHTIFPMVGEVTPPAMAAILNDAYKTLTLSAIMKEANSAAYIAYVKSQIAEHLVPLTPEEWFEDQLRAAGGSLGDGR